MTNGTDLLDVSNKRAELLAYFRRIACDLRSAQGSLSLLTKTCTGLSEQERTVLNDTATNIAYIAEDLLTKGKSDQSTSNKSPPCALVSLAVSEVLNKKRAEYKQVKFSYPELNIGSAFVFTKMDPKDLDFLVSSIIDRAVKASGNKGNVDLLVGSNSDRVWFVVTDYGKKLSPEEANDSDSVFDDGDFSRLHEILQNGGKVSIESSDTRTCVTVEFPVVDCPDWMAEYITLHDGDTVVVLSGDASIHSEWDLCFKKENVSLEHFTSGEKAIAFINSFSKKSRLFFLADFDLVNKELNGLQVLWQTLMQEQTIFIISSYSDQGMLEFAYKVGVQILPKQLISKIPYRKSKKD